MPCTIQILPFLLFFFNLTLLLFWDTRPLERLGLLNTGIPSWGGENVW